MAGVWRVVHKPRVAVRRDPSVQAEIVGVQHHGAVLNPVATTGAWLRIEGEVAGWVLSDGAAVGLGQLLERLDDKLMRLYVRHPFTGARALDLELPGNTLIGDARRELAKVGLEPSCALPCRQGATVIQDATTLYEAGFRDGDEFCFVYSAPAPGSPPAAAAPPDRQPPRTWLELREAASASASAAAAVVGALLDAVAAGGADADAAGAGDMSPDDGQRRRSRRQASRLLFAWGMAPGFGEVLCQSSGQLTVAVILGWGGSTPKQLEGVRRWWQDRDCATVLATRCPFEVEAQVEAIAANIPEGAQVVVHAFSNNGMYLLQELRRRWRGRLAGVVVDSAPDNSFSAALLRLVANGCIRALCALHGVPLDARREQALAGFNLCRSLEEGDVINWQESPSGGGAAATVAGPDGETRGLLMTPEGTVFLERGAFEAALGASAGRALAAATLQALGSLEVAEVWFPDLGRVLLEEEAPALFVYSAADTLIKARAVEQFIREGTREGQVRSLRLTGSHHVRHFEKHKEQYVAALEDFATSIGL